MMFVEVITDMKKIILAFMCFVLALAISGCAASGNQLENIDTAQSPEADSVSLNDYKKNKDLEGLEKYFIALNYIPKETTPTKMLASVIGAEFGDKYVFTVNNSGVVMELYEFNPKKLDENAHRVIGEIKETGEFHVFGNESIDGSTTYKATLSDDDRFMMIYTDTSTVDANVNRTADVLEAFKSFTAEEK